jgi:hypothetical protein
VCSSDAVSPRPALVLIGFRHPQLSTPHRPRRYAGTVPVNKVLLLLLVARPLAQLICGGSPLPLPSTVLCCGSHSASSGTRAQGKSPRNRMTLAARLCSPQGRRRPLLERKIGITCFGAYKLTYVRPNQCSPQRPPLSLFGLEKSPSHYMLGTHCRACCF